MPDQRSERRHEAEAKDNRSPFQRDRDRILYSSAFRRLAGVTQVVAATEGHRFHNRLTHTLKVAQVARRLAERLSEVQPQLTQDLGLAPEVAEAAALAHDLGHPPFGHAGETVLDDLVKNKGVPDGFEGNPQSFRIVTKLALRFDDRPGLNLTRATLDAILKYPWFRATEGRAEQKWGAYKSEEEDFLFARETDAEPDKPSVEAQVMDRADDVAYAVHDVEDFFRAGLVPLDRLRTAEAERARFLEWVAQRWVRRTGNAPDIDELDNILEGILTLFPITDPYTGTHAQRISLREFTSLLIGRYVQNTTLSGDGYVMLEAALAAEIDLLKELTWYYAIERRQLASQREGQGKLLSELFATLCETAESKTLVIPDPFREYIEKIAGQTEEERRARTRFVADCIASLTEEEAIALHGRLTGTRLGSVLDPL